MAFDYDDERRRYGREGYGEYYGEPYRYTGNYGDPYYRGSYSEQPYGSRYGYGSYYGEPDRDYGRQSYQRYGDYERWGEGRYGREGDRGFVERAGDEVRSWFGDEDAERRRRMDEMRRGRHYGRGPRGYRRSDERIKDDVNDRLTDDPFLDASEIEVAVESGVVTLTGTVESRHDKRRAEDLAEMVSGVTDVNNHLRVSQREQHWREQNWTTGRETTSTRTRTAGV